MKTISNSNFDLVVVDEAQKLSYGTDRFSLGELLSDRTNFLLMLCFQNCKAELDFIPRGSNHHKDIVVLAAIMLL